MRLPALLGDDHWKGWDSTRERLQYDIKELTSGTEKHGQSSGRKKKGGSVAKTIRLIMLNIFLLSGCLLEVLPRMLSQRVARSLTYLLSVENLVENKNSGNHLASLFSWCQNQFCYFFFKIHVVIEHFCIMCMWLMVIMFMWFSISIFLQPFTAKCISL